MFQAAPIELDASPVFETFLDLCVATEASIDLVEAASVSAGFQQIDFNTPLRRDVLKLNRRLSFRKEGFFLTAEQFAVLEGKKPTALLNVASLLAKPVNFVAVEKQFTAKFGIPNRRDLTGVGIAFASIAGASAQPTTYDEAHARYEAGEGDLVVIGLNDVREKIHVPSETTAMSYTRWVRLKEHAQ